MAQVVPELTLFDRLGGEEIVETAVGAFYFNVLNDQRVAHLFAYTDIDHLRAHQKRFLSFAFGGPTRYTGRSMRAAHQRLVAERGLNGAHFDAVMENLDKTLADLGVARPLIDEVLAVAESVRTEVLGL